MLNKGKGVCSEKFIFFKRKEVTQRGKPKVFPRKGQTETVNMTLFFLIAVILLFSAFIWGNSVIGGNSNEASLFSAEQLMRSLDAKIISVAKNGGSETLPIKPSAGFRMAEGNAIEYSFQNDADIPEEWIYLAGDESAETDANGHESVMRERKDGRTVRIQLYYRNRTGTAKFLIVPFIYYEGTGRNIIKIESNGTSVAGDLVANRVKLSLG